MPGTDLPFMGIFGGKNGPKKMPIKFTYRTKQFFTHQVSPFMAGMAKNGPFLDRKKANNGRTVPGRVYVPIGRIRGLNDNSHIGLKVSNNF